MRQARFLRSRNIGVKYLSIHNEGEDFYRWNYEDGSQRLEHFDYNMYWPPEQVNAFIKMLARRLETLGAEGLEVTNGEPSTWTRFRQWGYANALANDHEAMDALGLLTTHGFINDGYRKLSYGFVDGYTTNLLRSRKPGLKAWITSHNWGSMDTVFVRQSHEHIYVAGVNALIPWAGIQVPKVWLGGEQTAGHAITVTEERTYRFTPAYYLYKQLTHAARRGTRVARAEIAHPVCTIFAFAGAGSGHPDSFVVVDDIFIWGLPFAIDVRHTEHTRFRAYRSSNDGSEQFAEVGVFEVKDGRIVYDPPKGTVTTFIRTGLTKGALPNIPLVAVCISVPRRQFMLSSGNMPKG